MTRARRYVAFAKRRLRTINAEMPWEMSKLRSKGSRFVRNYSDEGDARLIIAPRVEDKVDVVPADDRHYEYAYVVEKFQEYDIHHKDILDVGSSGSALPTILAALGNHVVCIDVREWPVTWPNLEFVKSDLLESNIPLESFDVITCVSTIEHFGLGRYGDKEDVDGDIKGMDMLRNYLKPKGRIILTAPFGRPTIAFPAHRIYGSSRLLKLTSGFRILDKKFFGPIDRPAAFRPCTEEEAYSVDTESSHALVCCLLEKEN